MVLNSTYNLLHIAEALPPSVVSSTRLSITNDANASLTQPITEDSVHSSTILSDEHSIIGSNISLGFIESPNMQTHANVGQVLAAPELRNTNGN